MQDDGNLVTYTNAPYKTDPIWASGTVGRGGYAVMQSDGNFVIYNWADQPVFDTNTDGSGATRIVQQSDGNLVVYRSDNVPVWYSDRAGEDIARAPCSAYFEKTRVMKNTNFTGSTYKDLYLSQARPSWCGYYCAKETACKAYTYVPAGQQGYTTPVCRLKTSTGSAIASTGLHSGYKMSY